MYYHRLINLSSLRIQNEIKLIRQENIEQGELGYTNVSSAIPVKKNLARSAILSWTGIKDMRIKLELIQWRLGRIALPFISDAIDVKILSQENTQSFALEPRHSWNPSFQTLTCPHLKQSLTRF